jgi:uridine kinase
MIIAIGGSSTAGKSTLAAKIGEVYDHKKVKIFCQDSYVKPEPEIPLIRNHIDWEIPASIDFKKFYKAIVIASEQYEVVIAEGLMIYYHRQTVDLFNKRLFVDIDKETFLKRKARDLRWGKEPPWYMEHIWESYQKYGTVPPVLNDVFRVDGRRSIDIYSVIKFLES